MLALGGLAADAGEGRAAAEAVLADGRAAETFARMVSALGGPGDFLEHSARYLGHAAVVKPCTAERSGHVAGMDARQVGIAVVELGGGRRHADDAIDTSVGLSDFVDVGRHIHRGEPLCLVHAASEADADAAIALIRRAVRIEEEAPSGTPAILERVAL
jgi:thymidine phosphorylase